MKIDDVQFNNANPTKMKGYMDLSSDMNKLYEIPDQHSREILYICYSDFLKGES
ncbi:MAG: hypothetical protein ACE5HW_04940 [Candidatus Methanofastidiosia archaeon]